MIKSNLVVCCKAKHTKFQPSYEEWKCPRCGADSSYFSKSDFDEQADFDCELIHLNDEVSCESCNSIWSGSAVIKLIAQALNMIDCPHCKGKGMVKKNEQ